MNENNDFHPQLMNQGGDFLWLNFNAENVSRKPNILLPHYANFQRRCMKPTSWAIPNESREESYEHKTMINSAKNGKKDLVCRFTTPAINI